MKKMKIRLTACVDYEWEGIVMVPDDVDEDAIWEIMESGIDSDEYHMTYGDFGPSDIDINEDKTDRHPTRQIVYREDGTLTLHRVSRSEGRRLSVVRSGERSEE